MRHGGGGVAGGQDGQTDSQLQSTLEVHEIFRDVRRHRLVLTDVCSWTALPLKTGPTGCPETSVNNYHSTSRNIPQEGTSLKRVR